MTNSIIPRLAGGKGLLKQDYDIHVSSVMKITAVFWLVPSSEPGRKHIGLRLERFVKKASEAAFPLLPTAKINIPESAIPIFLSAVKVQNVMGEVAPWDNLILIKGDNEKVVRNFADRDITALSKILGSLSDLDVSKISQIINPEIVAKLQGTLRLVEMEKSLAILRTKVERDTPESEFQTWFEENTWIFGKNYVQRIPLRTIGLASQADLIYLSADGFADLVELKKSHLRNPMLLVDDSHGNYAFSSDLGKAIAQAMHYLQVIEDQRLQLADKYKVPLLRPQITIVIGRSNDWNEQMRKTLRVMNSNFVSLNIISYDHLLQMGENLLNLYRNNSQTGTEKSN